MKLLVSLFMPSLILVSCSDSSTATNHSSNPSGLAGITYDGEDDLNEKTTAGSPFARPVGSIAGFDVDGVLHTEVQYLFYDQYIPSRFVFETVGRNIRLQKEIKFLLNNGNKPNIVTHNMQFCLPIHASSQLNFLNSNGLTSIPASDIFCVTGPKSIPINNQNINVFYDDSPTVLEEAAKNSPATKLFMVLPKHQKVAHYFSDTTTTINTFVSKCGLLIVDDSTPKKRFLLQLRSKSLGGWWNFPGGSCAYHDNVKKDCSKGECEDPISGSIREFNEEAGKERLFEHDLDNSKRLMVLRSNDYMLFVSKFDKNYITSRTFIPQDKYAGEVSQKVFNIPNSPGYRWFDLDECKIGAVVDGHKLSHTGKTCETFRKLLEEF